LVQRPRGGWVRTLEFAGCRLAAQAIPASEPTAVARANRKFVQKYQPSAHAEEMVPAEILPTTLRLEPR
jgi:hypothetical protein